jgi:hypothetical protein
MPISDIKEVELQLSRHACPHSDIGYTVRWVFCIQRINPDVFIGELIQIKRKH